MDRSLQETQAPVQPRAGWYADPNGPGDWRWWDGQAWTHHVQAPALPPTAPAPAAPRPAEARPAGYLGWRLGVLIALLALVVAATAGGLVLVAGNDGPAEDTPTGQAPQGAEPEPVGQLPQPAVPQPVEQPPQPAAPQPGDQLPAGAQPAPLPPRVVGDEKAKLRARTAQSTMEAYAADNGGSYVGVTIMNLVDIEPTLMDASLSLPEAPMDDTYVIEVVSDTGNVFSIRRLASGAVEQTCETKGNAGCPETGRW